jgi:SpoVK/Ycf46/Vps4 family AAA+-type ATPase
MEHWFERFEEALAVGPGVRLSLNVSDRVCLEGKDPHVLEYFLAQQLLSSGYRVVTYSRSQGALEYGSDGPMSRSSDLPSDKEPADALAALTPLLTDFKSKLALIIDYADLVLPSAPGTSAFLAPEHAVPIEVVSRWGTGDLVRRTENRVILIDRQDDVHELLRSAGSGFATIIVDLPSAMERERMFAWILSRPEGSRVARSADLDADLSVQSAADLAAGLRLADICGLFDLAAIRGEAVTHQMITERKRESIRALGHDLVEVYEPRYGFEEIAGTDSAKEYFSDRIRMGNLPEGVVLAGPPGGGKTFFAKALAKEAGLPCLALRNIRSQWVGASERNLETALSLIRQLAPAIVIMDEIDQSFGQRSTGASGDSGTSERMMARLWEEIGENSADRRIMWCGITNRPDLLDGASLDRLTVVVPFLHPSPRDVAAIFPMLAAQKGRTLDVSGEQLLELAGAESLRLPTVRALHEIVNTAALLSDIDAGHKGSPLTPAAMAEAIGAFKPNYSRTLHEFLALKSLEMANFTFLFSWRTRVGAREGIELPPYVASLLDAGGNLDQDLLSKRVANLQRQLAGDRMARQV